MSVQTSAAEVLDELVARSRLIGSEEDLVVHGGGNTSTKVMETDHLGHLGVVLRVKGSGSDLATITAADFAGLRLDELLPLRERISMTDEEMTEYLNRCVVGGGTASPRPSIETLLHAFIPAAHVDHVHADAICALTNTPDGAQHVRDALGDDIAVLPWMRPGFALSRSVADVAHTSRAVVLAHHGLVTWGDTSEESIELTRELVDRAERYLHGRGARQRAPATVRKPSSDDAERLLLTTRGRLSRRVRHVLHVRDDSLFLSDRPDVEELAVAGPATADHLLRTRPRAAVVRVPDDVERSVGEVVTRYQAYVEKNSQGASGHVMRDPDPAVVLIPGLGVIAAGTSARAARVTADCAWHSLRVAADVADAFGLLEPLSESDLFDVDYWPLELAKLGRVQPRELEGHIYLVTGAASGIGRDVATDLSERGAHLVLADLDGEGLDRTASGLNDASQGEPELVVGDLCDETVVDAAVAAAIRRFGGIDGAVSNAGIAAPGALHELSAQDWRRSLEVNATSHFLLTKRLLLALRTQRIGGSIVYVASKNAFAPGTDFGAYSAAKAAQVQLARMAAIEGGPHGIRSNVVNPDAIFDGSGLWSEGLRAARADAHGVAVDDLEDFYAGRNLLGAKVTGGNVAEAVAFLLGDRAARTTGCVITVDGGVVGGFPR